MSLEESGEVELSTSCRSEDAGESSSTAISVANERTTCREEPVALGIEFHVTYVSN